jgi:hypothetical protein
MGKLWKILLAIGGIIAGLFMLKSNTSKKEFTKPKDKGVCPADQSYIEFFSL